MAQHHFSLTAMPGENEFYPLYFLEGEDEYLLKEGVGLITSKYPDAAGSDFNFTRINVSKSVGASYVYAACRELPFLSDVKIILVENYQKLPSSEKEKLYGYLSGGIPKTSIIIILNNTQGVRGKSSVSGKKSEASVKSLGAFIECRIDEKKLEQWLIETLKQSGWKMNRDAAAALKSRLGNDFWMVHGEINKLKAYCSGKSEITRHDVETICSATSGAHIYQITDSIIKGDPSAAITAMYNFTGNEDPPLSLLGYIKKYFTGIAETDMTFQNTKNTGDTAKILKKHEFVVRKNIEAAARLSDESYAKISDILVQTDYSFKKSANKKLIFEKMIIDLCNLFRTGKRRK